MLYHSDRLLELPLALFGITIATVILPSLSRDHAKQSSREFSHTLNWAIRLVFLFGLPASIALIYLSEGLIATLFFQGEMTTRDISMASLSLMAYAAGLLGHMLVKVLAPGYFARQNTRTPVKYGIVALVSNMVLNLMLVWQFKHAGLALATSLSAFINASLLFYGLRKSKTLVSAPGWWQFFLRVILANGCMLLILIAVRPTIDHWIALGFVERLAQMLLICAAGAVTYLTVLWLTGYRYKHFSR